MERDRVLRILQEHRRELKKLGVRSLALFGSIARDEATEESDVDLLIEFNRPATFDLYMDVKFFLEDTLGKEVDLVMKDTLKPRLWPYVEREAIDVA